MIIDPDELVAYVADFIRAHGYGPGFRDIQARFGVGAKTAQDAVNQLVGEKRLARMRNRSRSLHVPQPPPAPKPRLGDNLLGIPKGPSMFGAVMALVAATGPKK